MLPTEPLPLQPSQDEVNDLKCLGAELSALGCKTILTTGEGRQPRLDVLNPQARTLSRRIHAQADYFFWGTTTEPIAPRTAIPAAANLIARTLATTPTRARPEPHPGDQQ
jgi:hypothetical protein